MQSPKSPRIRQSRDADGGVSPAPLGRCLRNDGHSDTRADHPAHGIEVSKAHAEFERLPGSDRVLKLHNLDPKKDVTFVEAAIPNMFPMLTSHKVDLVYGARTLAADPAAQQSARVLFTQKDAMGTVQMNVWAVRQTFIDKHRAALVDYMEDALRAERWFLDPANRQEVVAIAAKVGKAPAAYFDSWLFTKKDQYHNPDMAVDADALQRSMTLMTDLGYVKSRIDVRKYLDKSIVAEASGRLR